MRDSSAAGENVAAEERDTAGAAERDPSGAEVEGVAPNGTRAGSSLSEGGERELSSAGLVVSVVRSGEPGATWSEQKSSTIFWGDPGAMRGPVATRSEMESTALWRISSLETGDGEDGGARRVVRWPDIDASVSS